MGKPLDQSRGAGEATRLGSYEIVRKIARGGMAELFLAKTIGPEGFEKLVVLKKILPKHAENPKFVRLFLDEAKLVATLDHPHIAHVYDMGKVDAHYFFTMEYIHGQDVRSTLRRTARNGRLVPIDHAVHITRNIAAALHYAHERKRPDGGLVDIVHRDVSPQNILISYDGAVKLVDFGVAKAATNTVKTRTGTLKGKISYMSPEQAKGSPIDRRSDIFSLGIVLWELVTTQRLFKGDNDLATIQMIINSKAEPPSKHNGAVPPELDRIVAKALATSPEDRYQTAEQLQLDLEELAREQKLTQSSVALRAFMHELFKAEIDAWTFAQAKGETLTDYLLQPPEDGVTTPVTESELEFMDEELDEDEDEDEEEDFDTLQAPATGSTESGVATEQMAVPLPLPPTGRYSSEDLLHIEANGGPTIVVADQTPMPGRGPDGMFPIAPAEWRQAEAAGTERGKRVLIAASIGFGAIVLLIAMFGGHPPRPRKPTPAANEEPTPVEIKMNETQAVDAGPD